MNAGMIGVAVVALALIIGVILLLSAVMPMAVWGVVLGASLVIGISSVLYIVPTAPGHHEA